MIWVLMAAYRDVCFPRAVHFRNIENLDVDFDGHLLNFAKESTYDIRIVLSHTRVSLSARFWRRGW